MRERLRAAVEEEAQVDMTPMIDCVFLLIIFFLCIDFKVLEAKLPAFLPKDVGTHSSDVEPQEKLNVKIICDNWGKETPRRERLAQEKAEGPIAFRLENHKIRWTVGPTPFDDSKQLLEALKRVALDPSKKQIDPKTQKPKLMGVVIEPGPEVTYGDVAQTLDVVHEAGFEDISFGGGLGARRARKGD